MKKDIKPLSRAKRAPLIKKTQLKYNQHKCTSTQWDLISAKLGYTTDMVKAMNDQQTNRIIIKIVTIGTKQDTKQLRKKVKKHYQRVKEIHDSGHLTKEDKRLIASDRKYHLADMFPDPIAHSKAMAMDTTEGTQKYMKQLHKRQHPIKSFYKKWI